MSEGEEFPLPFVVYISPEDWEAIYGPDAFYPDKKLRNSKKLPEDEYKKLVATMKKEIGRQSLSKEKPKRLFEREKHFRERIAYTTLRRRDERSPSKCYFQTNQRDL